MLESAPLLKRNVAISSRELRRHVARTGFVLLPQLIQSLKNVIYGLLLPNHIRPAKGARPHKLKSPGCPSNMFISFRSRKLYLRAFVS
jgi:hypothetical protein